MKKDIFEAYIRSRLLERKNSQYIISEIEDLVSRYNQLVLYDEEDKEVVFKPFWLNNFRYKDAIKQIELKIIKTEKANLEID
ncbi:hypothetical protein [Enterococcus faecalis]|uniref:hypothetical protein n=1 Tax=Enterococcus faecalis TaxID=1351 RepID=UPI000445C1C8|nr:hypothetical protein [Enterococcus faecalis]ETU35166.1 hypothetical protein P017_02942 [Enterococcus faecalis EnGen0417]MDU2073381.1 hypothetical protein [Streptococcus salivarius]MDU6989864.1 hypothetical protein [Escherichia coli]MDU7309314.1 hypothetical protein [Enterococcus faecalis]